MAARTSSTVVDFRIHNSEGIPGFESIISHQSRHTSINVMRQSSSHSYSTTSRKIMESISAGSRECHLRTAFWEGGRGIGNLNELAFETFRDLTRTDLRTQ